MFSAVDPNAAKGRDISARELLDRGRHRVAADAHGDPALKAELQSVLGRIYAQLGLYTQANELQQHAVATFKADGKSLLRLAQTEIDYANTLRELGLGDLKGAAMMAADASMRLRSLPETGAQEPLRLLNAQAKIAVSKRDFAEAKRYTDAAVELGMGSAVGDYLLADSLWTAASAEWGLKSLDRAENDYREALRLMTRAQGADSPRVGRLHGNLAMIMRSRSRYPEALTEAELGLAIDLQALGPEHPNSSTQTVTVDYATVDGSALAGSDYQASAGTFVGNSNDTADTAGGLNISGGQNFWLSNNILWNNNANGAVDLRATTWNARFNNDIGAFESDLLFRNSFEVLL